MMIDIYSYYNVEIYICYSYISNEDSTPNEKVFSINSNREKEKLNGRELIEIIVEHLSDKDISELYVEPDYVKIEKFDPISGETSTIRITYERNDK